MREARYVGTKVRVPGRLWPHVLNSLPKLARQSLRTLCCVEESPGSTEQDAG
jgi:hypothetical protein